MTWLAAALALAACRAETEVKKFLQASPASEVRSGAWLGGPEPLSGKLRSGLVTWWKFDPAQPSAGQPFALTVRVEEASLPGASVGIGASDGARLARAEDAGPWAVPVGTPSEVTVRLTAPPGTSYVNLALQQGERTAVRSIGVQLPGTNPADAARQRSDYATDAAGEPIVRMPGRQGALSATHGSAAAFDRAATVA